MIFGTFQGILRLSETSAAQSWGRGGEVCVLSEPQVVLCPLILSTNKAVTPWGLRGVEGSAGSSLLQHRAAVRGSF